ncbi:MAG: hypothetical protein Crog4KO_22950 [Crocinitomicaceae bacterium]
MPETDSNVKEVHYVVVVHGIGEQRPNETVPAVISRFAEARMMDFEESDNKPGSAVERHNFITMGKVAAQAGTKKKDGKVSFAGESPWSQFEGIPNIYGDEVKHFKAIQSEGEEDIRFVDMYWADILDDYFKVSGQTTEVWTDAVLSRMKTDTEEKEDDPIKEKRQTWIKQVLTHIQETALFATNVAGLPKVNVADELNAVMENVVGDIQIYGENRSVRGEAVARFHGLMEKIHEQHLQTYNITGFNLETEDVNHRYKVGSKYSGYKRLKEANIEYVRPKIHVVAHSLGTVLSLDAIMYAHVKKEYANPANSTENEYRNIPFEMYGEEQFKKVEWDIENNKPEVEKKNRTEGNGIIDRTEGEFVGSNWIDNLESFVTLGSPIDKFLVLYPENYSYLKGELHKKGSSKNDESNVSKAKALFKTRTPEGMPKIRHYNYCDEQDPVGHHLDLVHEQEGYQLIFDNDGMNRDVVFNQYVTPGVAHIKYWEDQILMRRILHQTVDGDPQNETNQGPKPEPSGSEFTEAHSPPANYKKVLSITYYWPIFISGLAMSLIFFWGWNSLKNDPTNYLVPALAAFVFSMAGYLLRKIIALLIWWRQTLRTKSKHAEKRASELSEKSKYHSEKISRRFRWIINGVGVLLLLFSVLSISFAIVQSNFLDAKEGVGAIKVYFIMLLGGGLIVYLYGKMKWSRTYVIRTTSSKAPEWITVGYIALASFLSWLIVHFFDDSLRSPDCCIDTSILSFHAILISGITIAWIYVRYTLFYVKRELLGTRTPLQIFLSTCLWKLETALAKFLKKHLFKTALVSALALLAYVIFSACY